MSNQHHSLIARQIIWDLDGTLVDSFGLYGEILAEILPRHGMPIPEESVLFHNYHGGLDESISNALGGNISSETLEVIVRDFLEIQHAHYEVVDHHLYPDALRLAKRAKEAEIFQVVVTNRAHEGRRNASPRSIVERSELGSFIDAVVCADDTEHRKPKREVVASLIQDGRLVPAETVVIGDQFVDAELARNLDAKAILVRRSDNPIAHMERLGSNWEEYVTIVSSLDEVKV